MDLQLTDKTAIVTGGSMGIGKAIALELAKEGVDVAIAARSKETLELAAKEIAQNTGRRVIPVATDMTCWEDVQRLVKTTVSELGKVDILVNNAAMAGGQVRGTLSEATEKDLIEDLDTKVVGYFRSMKAVMPYMQEQGWGRIINIGGISARLSTIYGLRNAAIVHMTKTFSDQFGADGITMNIIHPGLTLSDTVGSMLDIAARSQGLSREQQEKNVVANVAIKRAIDPSEVASVATFLASPRAECITGEVIATGGGSMGAVFQ